MQGACQAGADKIRAKVSECGSAVYVNVWHSRVVWVHGLDVYVWA